MSVLHILRDAADPRALPVIRAQADQGVPLQLLLLAGGRAPQVGATVFAVDDAPAEGAKPVTWEEALALVFGADTVVTW